MEPTTEPVVVTGIGPVCSEALSVQALVASALNPRLNGDRARRLDAFVPEQFLGKRGLRFLTPPTQYILAATQLALEDARLTADGVFAPEDIGVVVGTNFAIHHVVESLHRTVLASGAEAIQPMDAPNFSVNIPASQVAIRHKLRAFNVTLTSLLVAGLEAVALGTEAIARGRARVVVAGATEPAPPAPVVACLGGVGGAGGACALVLESLTTARARGAAIYAQVAGCGLQFVPAAGGGRPFDHSPVARRLRRRLDSLLPSGQPVVHLGLSRSDSERSRVVGDWIVRYLDARGMRVEPCPVQQTAAAEACVSPLLQAGALAAAHGEGLVVAVSPHGNLAMLALQPLCREESRQWSHDRAGAGP
jgi:3-oxoacyl-[acyl-carrier-protein] synthase II